MAPKKSKASAPKRKLGRPSLYTKPLAKKICDRISAGEPLAVICRDAGMPSVTTVWQWQQDKKDFSEAIARARLIGFDQIAAECLHIANTPLEGTEITQDKDGTTIKTSDMLGHRKLQIETRLKLLSKWDPKRYGDKIEVEGNVSVSFADAINSLNQAVQNAKQRS